MIQVRAVVKVPKALLHLSLMEANVMTSQSGKMLVVVWAMMVLVYGIWAGQSAMAKTEASDHARIVSFAAEAEEQPDKALYLSALASFHGEDYERTIKLADDLMTEYKDSAWMRKARFLKAKAVCS